MGVQVNSLNKVLQDLLKMIDLKKGIFMTGTDTDVGKTWVGCQIITALQQQGQDIAPRKPVESGWNDDITQTDAWKLASAANKQQQLALICPNRFNAPVSPSRAAQLEAREISIAQLKQQCLDTLGAEQILYIEGAGGFYSPLCQDGLNADLCEALDMPIILVADDKLGCINHVLLTVDAINQRGLTLICIILNQRQINKGETQQNNLHDLKEYLPNEIIIPL
ncbi:MAG: dethiobiotin synthase [Cocleimonas sp.]|nr:dethiobiotin synthase [Cocleimonas sp.]